MYLIHESTIEHTNGVIEIGVYIVDGKSCKKYNYAVGSKAAAETFHSLYRKGGKFHGRALTILNKNKLKGDHGTSQTE